MSGLRPRSESAVELPAGSTLLLYTDGLVEGRHRDIDVGIGLLAAALAKHPTSTDVDALCQSVLDELATDEQEDDIALLAVHVVGG